MPPRTATLVSVGVAATVGMMSAATSSSRPSRIERPKLLPVTPVQISFAHRARVPAMTVAESVPTTMTATPAPSMVLLRRRRLR
jgi:hypothetical protein